MAEDKLKDELKRMRQDKGELKRIKSLVGADRHVGVHDLSSIEKKFVQPVGLDGHRYVTGGRSIELVQKKQEGSGFSKLKSIIKKEETDLSEIKGLILSHRKKEPVPRVQEISLKQIEKIEKTTLAEVERDSKIVEQKPPVSSEPAGPESDQTPAAQPARTFKLVEPAGPESGPNPPFAGAQNVAPTPVGEKTNLNPAAIPISEKESKNKQAKEEPAAPARDYTGTEKARGGTCKEVSEKARAGTGKEVSTKTQAAEIQAKQETTAPDKRSKVISMPKEEAVDNRPLGDIIAEEEARDREKLAKEIEKEAASDAKKATEKKEEKPGRWASFISRIKPQSKEHAQPQTAQAQPAAQASQAGAQPAQTAAQPQAAFPQQIVVQLPSISSSPGKVTVQEEVDLRKLTMDVEKLGAELTSLKDTRTQSDERLQRIAEDVGELRSLFFQREEAFRDTQSTTEKLKSAVEELEPDKFLKALHKNEGELMLAQSKIEKLERISEEAGRQLKDAKAVLENVKGIENLKELLKEINTKSSKVEELHGSIERSTNKVEKLYVEVDRKLGEFNTFKAKLITLDELAKELMKIVDEAKIKLDDTPNKGEFTTLERGMQEELKKATDSLEGVKQQIVSQLSDIQSKSGEMASGMENFKQETRMQTTAVQMQFDKELAELRQQALMIIDAVKEEVQRNTINIDELKRMESFVELDRRIREHALPSANQPFKPEPAGFSPARPQQPAEEPKPAPRSLSPMEIRDSLEDMKKRKAELTRLIDFLEDEYHRGIISERSYRESKENTKNRLAEISRMIEIKSSVLKDMPQSAGADDGRDLYFSSQRVKGDVDRAKEGTPVSRLLDVQDRFDKINEMLGMLGERKQRADAPKPKAGQPMQKGISDGAHNVGHVSLKDSERIMSKVDRIRRSLDEKLDAAREHEHNIHHLHKEKERLKKYHPALHREKK